MSAETFEQIMASVARDCGEFVTCDYGPKLWFPEGNTGGFPSWALRAIADELDRQNRDWEAVLEADTSIGGSGQMELDLEPASDGRTSR